MEIISTLTQILSTLFANNQNALLFMAFLTLLFYAMSKLVTRVTSTFEKYMGAISDRIDNMSQSMATMSKDYTILSSAFEVHVATTEIKLDTLTKRQDKIEGLHLKP